MVRSLNQKDILKMYEFKFISKSRIKNTLQNVNQKISIYVKIAFPSKGI
jgi:hypothetical protein